MRDRNWLPLVVSAAAALVMLGCGGGPSSTAATPTPTPTPAKTPTPTPTPDPLALAALFEGTYTGTWNNTTYGTSGSIKLENKLDRTAGTMTSTLTLGGNVFGSPAKAPETFTYKLDPAGTTITTKSATFGDVTVNLKPPTFTMTGANISSPNVSGFEAHGTITDPKTLSLDYTVTLRAGGTATGKATITKG